MAFYSEMKKTYPAFEMLGIEVQGSHPEVIEDYIDFYGMKYPIAERGHIDRYRGTVLPVVIVFNHKGELILHKRIFDDKARAVVLEALKVAPHPLLGDKVYKRLAREAEMVKRGENLGRVLRKVREIWASDTEDMELWDEAYCLFSRLDNHAEDLTLRAEAAWEMNPVLGLRAWEAVSELFEGDVRGDRAKEAAAAIKGERSVPREEAAWKEWEKVAAVYEKHRFRITRNNLAMLETVRKLCSGYGETVAGAKALGLKAGLLEALKQRGYLFDEQ